MRRATKAESAPTFSRPSRDLLETVENILTILDQATTPQALNLPRYRLHQLKGDMKGFWAVTIRANWRIVFTLQDGNAYDVELIDYH